MDKPIVYYDDNPTFHVWGTEEFAVVYARNHYNLGQKQVRTSLVKRKFEDGSFETLNSLYKPWTNNEIQDPEDL